MQNSDDFQFKPLTEGLGFHKKTLELKEEALHTLPTQTGILPKPKARPLTATVPPTSQGWKPALPHATMLEDKNAVVKETVSTKYVPVSSHWPAAVFDTAMVTGFTLLFSAVVFALTKVEITTINEAMQSDGGLQMAALAIVFAVFEIYTVTCRTFFGKTLGEWVFDVRLGTIDQQKSIFYPFKVAWRTVVITLTGFIILPALSSALGEDIAGLLSGLQLYAEKYE